ncbi:type II secretory pathway pseudopilin PulG [Cytobacillus eiseniae]|uniref:Type II secretory pathway pseudopilin PulG n=1 Tax=Cytobacillus eiseniae TaxID=762947 RepID=A0ABS4RD90_9BACI|nr:hypothetical protein [Cytobacillus eiseniae]MBP2240864.1 type II secretory pathway pseudopilin PulG [Cytobacillus eiseniae]
MYRRNEGFFLAELLLSLAAWLIIASILFPLIIFSMNQSVQLKEEFNATQVLYEILMDAKKKKTNPMIGPREKDETIYEVTLEITDENPLMEVCVRYEDFLRRSYKKCEVYR